MWSLLKDTAASWSNHKASRLGAALAYYSIFSLGPLLVIAVAVVGLTFRQEASSNTAAGSKPSARLTGPR